MKFEELKASFKFGFKPVYLLSGIDEYLISTSYNLIVKYSGIQFEDLNIIKFSEGIIDCDDIVRALNTMPVFSDKKIVLLDLRMARKSELKNVKRLNEYIDCPNNMAILVISMGANDEDFGINKKSIEIVDCNRLDMKIVEAKINATLQSKFKIISSDAMRLLIEYCLCDLAKIIIEIDKLVAFVGDREKIEKRDIEIIVNRSIEYQIFELTEALSKKDSNKVYTILKDMQSKKEEYKTLPSLIYSHFRRLFHVALNQHLSNFEISKMLGIKEYAVKITQNQVKLFSKSTLKRINDLCIDLDYNMKQSNMTVENAIELLVLNILKS